MHRRDYLHGFPWFDDHHCHREAPPDQQEAGSILKLVEDDGAGCTGSGDDPSATFDPSTAFGPTATFDPSTVLGLESSPGGRAEPFAVLAAPASAGARGKFGDGLTSARIRWLACTGRSGGKAFLAGIGRLARCAASGSGMSPFSR
jgi:hypothetical protein